MMLDAIIDISDDDLVWVSTILIGDDITSKVTDILKDPETYFKPYVNVNDLCESILLKWAISEVKKMEKPLYDCFDVRAFFKNEALLKVLDSAKDEFIGIVSEYIGSLPISGISELDKQKIHNKISSSWESKVGKLNPEDVLLFDPDNPVNIIFSYGDIKSFYAYMYGKDTDKNPDRNRMDKDGKFDNSFPVFKSQDNRLHLQGEYGTNTVRILCPTNVNLSSKEYEKIQTSEVLTTLTSSNLTYVHFDILSEGRTPDSLFQDTARLVICPDVMVNTLNQGNKKFQFAKYLRGVLIDKVSLGTEDNSGVVSPEVFAEIMEKISSKLKKKVRFEIPVVMKGDCKMLDYQFMFQSQNNQQKRRNRIKNNVYSQGLSKSSESGNNILEIEDLQPSLIPCTKNTAITSPAQILDIIIQELGSQYNTLDWQVISSEEHEIVIRLLNGQMIKWVDNVGMSPVAS